MRIIFHILFFGLFTFSLNGQSQIIHEKGTVSYLSSRNVYVKFVSTKNINIGDTLFIVDDNKLIPALVVQNKSSTSSVCTPLIAEKMKVADEVISKSIIKKEKKEPKKRKVKEPVSVEEEINSDETTFTEGESETEEILFKQKIKGRISASSYSNLSKYKNTHRMRYALSFKANNIKNSKFSVENYITFRHAIGEWDRVKENLNNALKVYSLAVKYDFDQTTRLTLGRKINPKISSMGAIDGLQFEKGFGNFLLGAIVGSRPDHTDYSLNLNLFQMGVYASFISKNPKRYQQSTLGFIEQRNSGNVDRRFVYFQHSGDLMKNLNLFSSFEIDLYENINDEAKNSLSLTNMYVSLRYRLSKKIRFSASYDNRKNIIYYESYKSFIHQLIEDETRQGLRIGVNYRPFKYVTWGVNTSLRFQKNNTNTSRNLNSYISFSRIPIVKMRAALRVNFLQTGYIESNSIGIRLTKEVIKRRLNGDIYFRIMDYKYKSNNSKVHQNIAGISFSFKLMKKLTLYLYYEGTFDNRKQKYNRINLKIIKRF
jgi:hypothetical protein